MGLKTHLVPFFVFFLSFSSLTLSSLPSLPRVWEEWEGVEGRALGREGSAGMGKEGVHMEQKWGQEAACAGGEAAQRVGGLGVVRGRLHRLVGTWQGCQASGLGRAHVER